jgi:predicted RNA-binding protein YlxR (DUF448 family)
MEPVRSCVGCRARFAQGMLTRFVQRAGVWSYAGGPPRDPGRGVYLCSRACVQRVRKNKRFAGLASIAQVVMTEHEAAGEGRGGAALKYMEALPPLERFRMM